MDGLKKAISYSLKPHEMGFCGPPCGNDSKSVLRKYLLGEKYSRKMIADLLNEFHGSAGYYSLIAQSNNIKDIYDQRVVAAYWIGNELLDKVKASDLKDMILTNFVRPQLLTKAKAQKIIDRIPASVVPHHSLHVFFVGSITGRVKITPCLKDECKVSWGKVVKVFSGEKKIEVKAKKLFPEAREVKVKIDWNKQFLPRLKIGDFVSWHWGRAVERLTKNEFNNLVRYTMINYTALKKSNDK